MSVAVPAIGPYTPMITGNKELGQFHDCVSVVSVIDQAPRSIFYLIYPESSEAQVLITTQIDVSPLSLSLFRITFPLMVRGSDSALTNSNN